MLIVEKQLGANTLTVTRGVEAALEEMKPALAGVAVDPTIFRPATFIEMSLQNLSRGAARRLRAGDARAAWCSWRTGARR